ncbi:MAG: protein kinase domain-containing protein, partial [Planctomycetaceae bacterium]
MSTPAADFEYLWSTGKADSGTVDPHEILGALRLDQQQRWKTHQPQLVEDYLRQLQAFPQLPTAVNWTLELVVGEWHSRPIDQPLTPPDLQSRFPDLVDLSAHLVAFPESANALLMIDYVCDRLEELYRSQSHSPRLDYCLANLPVDCRKAGFRSLLETELECLQQQLTSLRPDTWLERFPQYHEQIRLVFAERFPGLNTDHRQLPPTPAPQAKDLSAGLQYIRVQGQQPSTSGRYRLDKELGKGAFGLVYLGYDEELQRQVAVKMPTGERLSRREYADQFLAEARTVAALNHPHIVSVYDVGRGEDNSIYLVSRYIPGGTLQKRLQEQRRPDVRESVRLLIPIAQALHYAHQQGILHRDIKPANLLLDADRVTPFVADFGLAIREDDELTEHGAGTPAYMSPEQASREAHRLDGRSDVFSVGVVFYEMLTGMRPFHGKSIPEVLDAVVNRDPQPPRSLQPQIPAELERICLKALAKQASDRYATAEALAADLQAWLSAAVVADTVPVVVPVKPRGLRSFEDSDAGFFLDLLPGSRNRDGLPDSIDFWKQRIEEPDASRTFAVGMICGPSGCGKSSLVKAGLLPRLSPDLVTIYLEATPDDTEDRLCAALRRRLPRLPASGDLVQLLHTIRRNRGPKVAIFLDQFEQWLHANPAVPSTPLVRALRQCNGSRLQAVIMIRDDFNLPAGRFMNAMDLRVVQGENYAMIDLFDVPHATRVLVRFGQALGHLPETGELGGEQRTFVDRVIKSLQVRGRVVPVQLSILADMLSHRPWNLKTLEEIGGAERIGEVFLEEIFSGPRANPQHRQHATAARGVLKALLPAIETKIKGASKNLTALQQAAGYQDRSNDFHDLLKILDAELRLITLTDTTDTASNATTPHSPSWQLTHDYLVPSLRDWLTRKQEETARGRAELKLEDRTLQYTSRREQRYLPGLFEWLEIFWLTRRQHWSSSERQVMRTAGRLHLLRTAAIAAVLIVCGLVLRSVLNNRAAEALVTTLREAKPDGLTVLLQQADEQGPALDSLLRPIIREADKPDSDAATKLAAVPARLAVVLRDESQLPPLQEAMLSGELTYVEPIRTRLRQFAAKLRPQWLELVRNPAEPAARRFRAALGVVGLDGDQLTTEWTDADIRFVATELSTSFAEY